MSYRLESISRVDTPQRCAVCRRKHQTVVTFRELVLTVPPDQDLPVVESDGGRAVTTGTTCARRFLDKVPVYHYAHAVAQLDALTVK